MDEVELARALARLHDNLSAAPPEAEKCFVSLDDHRTILAALAAPGRDELVEALRECVAVMGETLDRDFGFWSSPAQAERRAKFYPAWREGARALIEQENGNV